MSDTVNDPRNVFVVHGRNLDARNSLFRFLRSIGLRPLEWSQAVRETGKASPFIGEILDVAFSKAQAVVVLLTPDDEARLREPFRSQHDPPYEPRLTGQARPNVLFEAGMAMGRNPDRTVIVELGSVRPFSDIAGRHTVRLSNDTAGRQELAQRLETAGCPVDLTGRDWHTEGDFNLSSLQTTEVSSEEPNTGQQSAGAKGLIFTAAEEVDFKHIRQKLDRDTELSFGISQRSDDGKSTVEVGKEVYRVNLLGALIGYLDEGYHVFTRRSLEIVLSEKLNAYLQTAASFKVKRGGVPESIKDNLVLELQTYGLAKFAGGDIDYPLDAACDFVEKMYRFRYWLDYNNTNPELHFDLVSKTERPAPEQSPAEKESRILSYAQQVESEVRFNDYHETWCSSEEGVLAARQEVEKLWGEIRNLVKIHNDVLETFKIDLDLTAEDYRLVLSGRGLNLVVTWVCPSPDTLKDSLLSVEGYKSKPEASGHHESTEQHRYYQAEYEIDLKKDLTLVWRRKANNDALATDALASDLVSYLLSMIRRGNKV